MFGRAEVLMSVQHRIQVSRLWVLEGEAHAPVKGIRDVPFADTTKKKKKKLYLGNSHATFGK